MSRNYGNNNNNSSGVGFFSLLALAFIVLKLAGVISWSWWWVLSPIWIPTIIVNAYIIWLMAKK